MHPGNTVHAQKFHIACRGMLSGLSEPLSALFV